ncbi:MAG: CoA ester lyase [Pseudomonadales bacterium]
MSAKPQPRIRRSCLYMPGANARALEKARSLAADMIILDLEDSVAPDAKHEARDKVQVAIQEKAYGYREVVVRSNALDTEWGSLDIEMAVRSGADGVLVPKITCEQDIVELDALLTGADAPATFLLWVMIEMPLAILNIQQIAAQAQATRLAGFMLGPNDLAKELRSQPDPSRSTMQTALGLTLLAARAFDLVALDGVYNDIKNETGFASECEQGRAMGFDGKTLIHPSQIDLANRVFAPSEQAVAHAKEVIAAFALPENKGKGVITVNGAMTELLHLDQARELVQFQQAIEQRAPT